MPCQSVIQEFDASETILMADDVIDYFKQYAIACRYAVLASVVEILGEHPETPAKDLLSYLAAAAEADLVRSHGGGSSGAAP